MLVMMVSGATYPLHLHAAASPHRQQRPWQADPCGRRLDPGDHRIGLSGLLYGSAIVTVGIVISPALMRERTHRLKSKTQSPALHRHWSRTNSRLARLVSGSTRPFSLSQFRW